MEYDDWIGSTKVDILRVAMFGCSALFVLAIGCIIYFSSTKDTKVIPEITPVVSSNSVKIATKPMTVNKYKTIHQMPETFTGTHITQDIQIPEVNVVQPTNVRADTVDDLNLQLKQLNTRLLKGLYEN